MRKTKSILYILVWLTFAIFTMPEARAEKSSAEPWTKWARSVGQSEADRSVAIKHLRSHINLSSELVTALDGKDRALSLDVISALNLKELVPILLSRALIDRDGFTLLTVNSLLDDNNKKQILDSYQGILKASLAPEAATRAQTATTLSPANLIAILEPLGRLGVGLASGTATKEMIANLLSNESPDVRSAALYYIRMMALTHHEHGADTLVRPLLRAKEFQLRLQSVSLLVELQRTPGTTIQITNKELFDVCESELDEKIKGYCLSLLSRSSTKVLAKEPAKVLPHPPVKKQARK